MIKETTKKIHFIPYTATKGRDADVNPAPVVALNRNSGLLWFGEAALREMGMRDKFVRFFYEPTKKVIGWQIKEVVHQADMKTWRLVKPYVNKKSGASYWTASLKKLVVQIPSLTKKSYTGLPVQKYREINPLSEHRNQVFFFVELVDNPDELRKGVGNRDIAQTAAV